MYAEDTPLHSTYVILHNTDNTDMFTIAQSYGNSRKAWQTIRKISNDSTASKPPCMVTANQVAHQLLVNSRR